jgi:hypothetical protein
MEVVAMAEIMAVDKIAEKWARVTPGRSADYEEGVRSPVKNWERQTTAASDAWKTGIQQAIAAGSFGKGVARVGQAGWQVGAIEKGVARWGPGVQVAQDKYQTALAPYVDAIRRVTLPPRYARRDPRNLDRVRVVVDALVKAKAGRT